MQMIRYHVVFSGVFWHTNKNTYALVLSETNKNFINDNKYP